MADTETQASETERDNTSATGAQSDPALLLLLRLTQDLWAEYPQVLVSDAEALHRFRIASRRLRVLLGLMGGLGPRRRVRRARRTLRSLERATGRTRDLWVVLDCYDGAHSDGRHGDANAAAVRRRLLASIRGSHRMMVEGLLDADVAGLRADLRRISRGGEGWLPTVLDRLRARARREGRAFVELAAAHTGRRLDIEALHLLRRRARRLRYLAEADATLTSEETGAAKRFKSVQDLLGEVRDQWLLREWANETAERAERTQPPAVAAYARQMAQEAQKRLRAAHTTWQGGAGPGLVSRGLRRMGAPLSPSSRAVS